MLVHLLPAHLMLYADRLCVKQLEPDILFFPRQVQVEVRPMLPLAVSYSILPAEGGEFVI
jgi:hypothetical protein